MSSRAGAGEKISGAAPKEVRLWNPACRGFNFHSPKDVDWFGEDIVVDEPGVDGEGAHQGNQVAPVEEVVPNLVIRLPRL